MNKNVLRVLLGAALCAPGCGTSDSPIDGGDPSCIEQTGPGAPIVINEIMASNALTLLDEQDRSPDWIELYNPTAADVPLCSYSLTTDLAHPRAAVFSQEAAVPAGGYLLVWLDDKPHSDWPALPLRLDTGGGDLGLAGPDGAYVDRVTFGAQATDLSAAREPDGSDSWAIEWHVSPGAANPDGDGEPVAAEDPMAPPEKIPAAGDLTEKILGYDVLFEIGIRIDDAGMAALEAHPYRFVPGTLVYQGREYGPVGVRLKGQNSFEPIDMKPSFRINIDEYASAAKFFQLDDLTLNNMHSDRSMMHERLAYLVTRQRGPASRANHAMVTLNGELYGLYINVETVKWRMVARWFDDPTGPLYEGTDADFVAKYIGKYEHESGPDDRTLMKKLAEALTIEDPDKAIAEAGKYVDLQAFWRFWAACAVVGQFDSFPYSSPGDDYFVYADPTSKRLHFMPWGMDETFFADDYDVKKITSVLAKKCRASSSCLQGFANEVWATLDAAESLDWTAEIDRVAEQIAPYTVMDKNKPYTDAAVLEYQDALRYFVNNRRTRLSGWLPPPN